MIKGKLARRILSWLLLLIFGQSVILPNYSFALTTGPHQPEYISFSDPGANDMVNLLTGDFSFNLPVLEVPGPEGAFSVPLSYNAGIGLDQESSWVGLGWNMNVGAITRTINEYPDDANGEANTITVQDLTGLRGWDSSILGMGRFGWNSNSGRYTSMTLLGLVNVEMTEEHYSVGIMGINVTDDGLEVDPVQLAAGVATIISWGAAGAAAGVGKAAIGAIAKQIAISSAVSIASDGLFSLARGSMTPSVGASGSWGYSKTEKKNWGLKVLTGFVVNVNEYKIWLDKTRNELMYGTLYLGNAPTVPYVNSDSHADLALRNGGTMEQLYKFSNSNNQGSASDVNYQILPGDERDYYEINNPISIAEDNFSVAAVGISGSIVPYRLDIGSVSMPRQMTDKHERLSPVRFVTNDANYKVPFVYNGQLSNAYFHHAGGATSVTSPTFHFGISTYLGDPDPLDNEDITYDLNDVILKNERISSALQTYKKIPQGSYIEWLSNDEIRNAVTYGSKYMDYFSGGTGPGISTSSDRYLFRSNLPFGDKTINTYTSSFSSTIPISAADISNFSGDEVVDLNISFYDTPEGAGSGSTSQYVSITNQTLTTFTTNPPAIVISNAGFSTYYGKAANIEVVIHETPQSLSSIGGFCITAEDGTTYHFGLPSYDYNQYTEVRDVSDPTNKRSVIKRNAPFANTWLLTGITGSDFVDRNQNGVIDDNDWGHWVKFNYGTYMNDYKWRLPYANYKRLPDDSHETFTQGLKQLIYLNSIETRSHVALFLKSPKLDGRSANTSVTQRPLKLDEIVLVNKEHYAKMIRSTAQGGFGFNDFANKVSFVLQTTSLSAGLRTFLNQNAEKRIVLTQTYELAAGTNNSDATGGKKLTLSRVAIYGRADKKIVPDYRFEYANNPAYNANHWDGFGMYNSSGTSSGYMHSTSSVESDGSAWSLTKITTPLGSDVLINYERDTYSSISGMTFSNGGVSFTNYNFNIFYPTGFPITKVSVPNPGQYLEVGDSVRVQGYATYYCSNNPTTQNKNFETNARIVAIGPDYVDVGVDYMNLNCNITSSGQYIHFDAQVGSVIAPLKNTKGGDIRVGSLVMKDEFGNENKIRYIYKNADGTSSGVIAKLPEYIGGPSYSFESLPGYPASPVLYGNVAILAGKLTDDTDYYSKHVYEFEMPHYLDYTISTNAIVEDSEPIAENGIYKDFRSIYSHKIEDRTAAIGKLKSIKIYDKSGQLYASSKLNYTDQVLNGGINNYQGVYTKSALMFDRVHFDNDIFNEKYHKINRTLTVQYPSVLKSIESFKDGFTSSTENLSWDFYTGRVLEKLNRSPLGVYVKSVVKPAYTVYPELGVKGLNPSNKNIVSADAATYTFSSDPSGASVSMLGASVQLWNKTWANYRVYNSGTQTFASSAEGDDVWRKGATYAWIGDYSRLRADGSMTYNTADAYNFSQGASNPLWKYLGEPARYDHYSMPLEAKDFNNIYTAVKMGYGNRKILATASNAKHNEIAFSSAEDLEPDKPFFGGEVALGSGVVKYMSKAETSITHTGDAVLSLTTGYGFVFKSTELIQNRTYRASVWTNRTNGRIYYKLNGGSEVLSAAPTTVTKAGDWYRVDVQIPVGSATSIEIGVKSTSGTTLFDDFRFQPMDAAMTCFVQDPLSYEYASTDPLTLRYEYVLDNDNLAVKYEYSARGALNAIYRESTRAGTQYNGFKKVAENSNDFRRFSTNQ